MQYKVQYKKDDERALDPVPYDSEGNAWDLRALEIQRTFHQLIVKTGISIKIPEGTIGLLIPKFNMAHKRVYLSNMLGTVLPGKFEPITLFFTKEAEYDDYLSYQPSERCIKFILLPNLTPTTTLLRVKERSEGSY